LRMHIPRVAVEKGASVFRELREGFSTVFASQWLWISILLFAFTNITLSGPYNVAMPFLVNDNLGGSVEMLGILYACFPLGYIIGGVILGSSARIRKRGILLYVAGTIGSLALAVFGLVPPLWVLVIAALINGAALEMGHLTWINTLQEQVPNDKLGRVVSIDNMGSFALLPIGFALAGWATEMYGAPFVFLFGCLATAAISAAALLIPAIRNLD